MLKVLSYSTESLPESFITEYGIPLKIRWGMLTPLDYWSIGHPKYSLIEFGIEKQSKLLRIVILVSPHKVIKNSRISFPKDLPVEIGIPVCNIYKNNSPISNSNYVEETYDFEIHLFSEDKVCIITYPFENIVSWVVYGRVKFGLDQNRCLCLLLVDDLSQLEKAHLVSTIDMILEQRSESN